MKKFDFRKTKDKQEVLAIVKEKYGISIDFYDVNTHFSRVNKSKPVWWIEIPMSEIEEKFNVINLIVVDSSGGVVLMQVPVKYFLDNVANKKIKVRDDKNKIHLEIDVRSYRDVIGMGEVSFKQFEP
jgi:hypothetical protein